MEEECEQETSLVGLHEKTQRAGSVVARLAQDLATAKVVLADSFLTLGKLNRSQDDLDAIDIRSAASGKRRDADALPTTRGTLHKNFQCNRAVTQLTYISSGLSICR
ncbi:hypothetical protein SK128_001503 [Halocaridina rubra]|uniref:Uncharacterized protein n=1 Tax=Halocaridina rubra TaxID=373956 RepID=A0AAN9A6F0_HALRR